MSPSLLTIGELLAIMSLDVGASCRIHGTEWRFEYTAGVERIVATWLDSGMPVETVWARDDLLELAAVDEDKILTTGLIQEPA